MECQRFGSAAHFLPESKACYLSLTASYNDDMQKPEVDLAEEVTFEAEWADSAVHQGPHCLIQQPDMRLFWWRTFGSQEEVTWDVFWSRFPKDLNRQCTTSILALAFLALRISASHAPAASTQINKGTMEGTWGLQGPFWQDHHVASQHANTLNAAVTVFVRIFRIAICLQGG